MYDIALGDVGDESKDLEQFRDDDYLAAIENTRRKSLGIGGSKVKQIGLHRLDSNSTQHVTVFPYPVAYVEGGEGAYDTFDFPQGISKRGLSGKRAEYSLNPSKVQYRGVLE